MALTSADVNNVSFSIDRKGYDVDEVDVFLEQVADAFDALYAQIEDLEGQVRTAERKSIPATSDTGEVVTQAELDSRDARIQELEAQVADHRAEDNAIAQALVVAQRSADEIIANANKAAENTKRDAEDESQRILDKANAEKQRVLEEIRKLEDDREEARGKYSDMLKDFINSSEGVLASLGPGVRRYRAAVADADDQDYDESDEFVSDADVATYTTPTMGGVTAPAAPTPSKVEKDFSGFGDTDDDIDIDDLD